MTKEARREEAGLHTKAQRHETDKDSVTEQSSVHRPQSGNPPGKSGALEPGQTRRVLRTRAALYAIVTAHERPTIGMQKRSDMCEPKKRVFGRRSAASNTARDLLRSGFWSCFKDSGDWRLLHPYPLGTGKRSRWLQVGKRSKNNGISPLEVARDHRLRLSLPTTLD